MKMVVGLVLLLLGSSLFLLSLSSVTRADIVIEVSFVLGPGEKYGPDEDGTYYHTRVISKSTLTGEVVVEGGGINFTSNGYNTQHLKNVFVDQNYSFVINPADDLYTFTFDHAEGGLQSSIKFTLEERWMEIPLLILGFVGLLMLVPAGLILIIMSLRKKATKRNLESRFKS